MSEQELLESLVEYLIEESYVDNGESALVLVEHLSDDALENILIEKAASEATGDKYRSNPELRRQRIEQDKKAAQTQFKDKKPSPKLNLGTDPGGKLTSKKPSIYDNPQLKKNVATLRGLARNLSRVTSAVSGPVRQASQFLTSKMLQSIGTKGSQKMSKLGITTKPKTQTITKPETKTQTITKPETKTQTQTITKPETKTQTQTKLKDKTETQTKLKDKTETQTKLKDKTKVDVPVKTKVKDPGPGKKARKPRNLRLPSLGGSISGGTTRALGGHISKARDPNESFEMVCDFLIQEGYAETGPQAEAMYNHMSDEWMEFIHEQF